LRRLHGATIARGDAGAGEIIVTRGRDRYRKRFEAWLMRRGLVDRRSHGLRFDCTNVILTLSET